MSGYEGKSAAEGLWTRPPEAPRLADGEVHLWRVDLGTGLPAGFESVVSPDELERAGRFSSEDDKHRHLLSSYATRDVLSRYLRVSPGGIPIAITPKGKPHLKGEEIRFSVSHSRSVAVVAVAGARVGVDVEELDMGFPHMEVAERYFSDGEVCKLRAEADRRRRAELFFSYWTRKEAVLKASGEGLYADPGGIDFSGAQPGEGSWIDHGGARWAVVEIACAQGVFCSLALEGELRRVERYIWEPLGQQ